jgi:hypothetical protein
VLNVGHHLFDGTPQPAQVQTPQALKLTKEPLANAVRYDTLRTARKAAVGATVKKEAYHAR